MTGRRHFEAMGRRGASYGLSHTVSVALFAPGLRSLPSYARGAFMRGWLLQDKFRAAPSTRADNQTQTKD